MLVLHAICSQGGRTRQHRNRAFPGDILLDCIVSYGRLGWLGHVVKVPDDKLPKRMLFAHVEGNSPNGGILKPWTHHAMRDLEALGLSHSGTRKREAIPSLVQCT